MEIIILEVECVHDCCFVVSTSQSTITIRRLDRDSPWSFVNLRGDTISLMDFAQCLVHIKCGLETVYEYRQMFDFTLKCGIKPLSF
jgi:hypothetical protein